MLPGVFPFCASEMAQTRRTFLSTVGAAAFAAACRHSGALTAMTSAPAGRRKIKAVGIQLYTLRRPAAADLAGTLSGLAKIGYKEIEFAGFYNHSATEVRDMLKANGLTAPSTHIGLNAIQDTPAKVFEESHIVGHEWITVPSLSGRRETVDDWKRTADQFNKAAAQLKAAGFRFGFHNHNAELRKVDGQTPLEILIGATDPALVSFEMDIYWVVNGGGDPVALLDKYPDRFKMLHVKDSMGPPDQKMADVGAGVIDFKPIFAHATSAEHYFVERDDATDPMASAATSYKTLSTMEF
jgi:sugar phosphate isomerase/epimerase